MTDRTPAEQLNALLSAHIDYREHDHRAAVTAAIDAGWRAPARVIETDVELAGTVPDGSIVRSNSGTIACRFDYGAGVVFGDDRPFPWGSLDLPVTVLWTPEKRSQAAAWCMCGHHERWHAEGPCTFYSDTEKCRCPSMEPHSENGDTR